jgi:hypothetical protein
MIGQVGHAAIACNFSLEESDGAVRVTDREARLVEHRRDGEVLRVTEPDRLQNLLDEAEAALRPVTITQKFAGFLVPHHDPRRYTTSLLHGAYANLLG